MLDSMRIDLGSATAALVASRRDDARLARVIRDAAEHVPMYRSLWADVRISTQELPGAEDLQRLPLLDKAIVKACPAEDRLDARRREVRRIEECSSGSSGEPVTIVKGAAEQLARQWTFLRALVACGYRPGQRCLLLTSRRESRNLTLARWSYASIGERTEALLARYEALRPDVLYGPLSTLELLAMQPHAHAPRLLVTTAEQLTRQRRAVLERGFGAPIADFYGLTEFGLVAYRPPGCATYRIARSSLLLEFLPVAGEAAVERLVVTDRAQRVSPLIRYDTGDFVARDVELPGRPIVGFAGRSFDCITLPGGARCSPYRLDVVLEHVPGLAGFEVVQQPDLSIDLTLEVEQGTGDAVRAIVARELDRTFGTALPVRLRVGAIRRPPAGTKFRPIRSAVRSAR